MKDNEIRRFSVQCKALKKQAEKLIKTVDYAPKEPNDEKLSQKEDRDKVLDLQEHTNKTIL